MKVRRLSQACAVLGLVLLVAAPSLAHRVNVFAWVEGGTVLVECTFPDGTKVHEGVIRVLDSAGAELLSGRTNEKGEFSFQVPKSEDLTIVLEAGMGHRADWPLSKQDLDPSGPAPEPVAPSQPSQKTDPAPSAPRPPQAATDLDQAIEKALDKKLAPVLRMLAELHEQKVRLSDILGGIGYIIGLVGIAAYFKRKK